MAADRRAGAGEKGKENKPLRKATVALLRAPFGYDLFFYRFRAGGTDQQASDAVPASHSKIGGVFAWQSLASTQVRRHRSAKC